ncbi:MAG: hypothetical protein RIE08_18035 [Acidimicrobiales bacterium]
MTAPVLRLDACQSRAGALVAPAAEPGGEDVLLVAPVGVSTLAALPQTVVGISQRVVVDLVAVDPRAPGDVVERVVDGVWSLACGAEVRTDLPDDLAAAASVLTPDGGGVARW